MHANTIRLREIMRSRQWNSALVARLLGRKPSTVRQWRCNQRIIPDRLLARLEGCARLDAEVHGS
jgi:hypothetical protein